MTDFHVLEVSTYFTEFLRQVRCGCPERLACNGISGLVVKYIVAIDVTRVHHAAAKLGACVLGCRPNC
jgi:hypothetical protein